MKNNYAFKRFAFINLLLLGTVSGTFAQDNPCAEISDVEFRNPRAEFCEGEGKGMVDMTLTKGTASDYLIHWWQGADDVSGTLLGDDMDEKFFENLESKDGGMFSYQIVDKNTGCVGEVKNYEIIVNPIPDAPKDEHLLYSINGNASEILTTEKFKQTLDPSKKLWWFKSMDEPNSKGTNSVLIDRSVPTYNLKPYEFFIAYQDGDCFGERAKVVVEVLAAPTPSVKVIDLCKDGTFDPLDGIVATDAGYELIWFKSPTDTAGKALSSAPTDVVDVTTPGKYILYVAQRATTEPYAQSDVIDIGVDVIAVEKPKVNHSVSYSKSEAFETKEFVDILVKSPDVIDNVAGQTLLWAVDQNGDYEKGSPSSSKPYYDERLSYGIVEKQERWVKWEMTTAAGLTCQSDPEKIDIIIRSTPAPIVRNIEICEDVFRSGSIPSENEPANNAVINAIKGSLPDADKYELVWFDNRQDAYESMTNSSKLSLGRRTAPTLTDVFSGVDMSEPYESEWEATIYVVQSYDDGAGNVTTSSASPMKITVNATPKLQEEAHEPVCKGPVDLTRYWNLSNKVSVDEEYMYEGSLVTQNATNLTKSGKYTIVVTSLRGCKSDPLEVQLDIRNISLEMDPISEVKPGTDISLTVKPNFSYNVDGREAKEGKVKLSWSSEENISDKPTDNGTLDPDAESFIYNTGKFDGKPGDTHTITISVTDGYCVSTATHIVTVEKQSAVDPITAENADDIVNVYTVSGALVKANVKRSEALKGLLEGIYVVGNEKMIVR
ncbi:MAG: hypothetical protein K6E14_05830 [Paludibacteraceae bacterium]|nr:hypothetical protein [Paludibacteraceae bacterium]